MYRLAVCLLFITIFLNGIKISVQEETSNTTTLAPEILKTGNSSEPSAKENDVESVKKTDDVSRKENNITADPEDQVEKTTEHNATLQDRIKNSQEFSKNQVHGSVKKARLDKSASKENATEAEKKADDDSRRENYITAGPEDYQEPTTPHSKGKLRLESPSSSQEPKTMEKIDPPTSTATKKPKYKFVPEDDFTSKILGPVMQVQARISDTISKGVDGAKGLADEAYKVLKETVNRFF